MKLPPRLPLLLLILTAPLLVAADKPGSPSEFYAVAAKIDREADQKLNAAYQRCLREIREHGSNPEITTERLRESQRAWLKYREAQVAFVAIDAGVGSPTARAVGSASYSAQLTEERIKDLDNVPNPF